MNAGRWSETPVRTAAGAGAAAAHAATHAASIQWRIEQRACLRDIRSVFQSDCWLPVARSLTAARARM